jgi:hypothetical protein
MAAALFTVPAYAGADDKPLLHADFESPHAPLAKRLARHEQLTIERGAGVDDSHALKATYVGYPRGSQRIVMTYPLPRGVTEATLQYDVKFDRDFQFVRGGKLHGLGPERRITGGRQMQPDGWSARVTFKQRGALASYIYCQDKQGKYGQSVASTRRFHAQKGRYYAVSLHVKLNDPPRKDNGFAAIYVNGQGVVPHADIQYRAIDGERTLIQKFLFSTFHGGHEPKWAPKDANGDYVDVHAYFDNIAVYPGKQIRDEPAQ